MTALVVAVVVSLPFLLVLAFRPLQRRLAVRNARRRPVEAMLVIAGTLLGTAIITGSLIVGDTIDGVNDLSYQQTRFKELRLTLRPGKKHKLRFDYIPISFSSETTLKRDIVFNGIKYSANLPVNSSFKWGAYHLGYEYDFLYRDRWFVGVVLEAKYTHVKVDLNSPVDSEYTDVAAPIPAIGGIFHVYPVSYVSFTGEITGFKLPTSVDKQNRYDGKYMDYNFYGTLNLTNNFGAQVGYRNIIVMYRRETDEGHFKLKGMYFGAVARF
jgi:hypothetical protein